jgi:hypothetical protein
LPSSRLAMALMEWMRALQTRSWRLVGLSRAGGARP